MRAAGRLGARPTRRRACARCSPTTPASTSTATSLAPLARRGRAVRDDRRGGPAARGGAPVVTLKARTADAQAHGGGARAPAGAARPLLALPRHRARVPAAPVGGLRRLRAPRDARARARLRARDGRRRALHRARRARAAARDAGRCTGLQSDDRRRPDEADSLLFVDLRQLLALGEQTGLTAIPGLRARRATTSRQRAARWAPSPRSRPTNRHDSGAVPRDPMSQYADNEYLFTSESVTEGHPDKVADQISDGVLDAVLRDDPYGRVACETLVNTGPRRRVRRDLDDDLRRHPGDRPRDDPQDRLHGRRPRLLRRLLRRHQRDRQAVARHRAGRRPGLRGAHGRRPTTTSSTSPAPATRA